MTQIPHRQTTSLTPADLTLIAKNVSTCVIPNSSTPPEDAIKLDIEHALVEDDPRIWSHARKVSLLLRYYEWTPSTPVY